MEIYKETESKNWGVLTGNIAPKGARLWLGGLPDTSHAFRGSVRLFSTVLEAVSALGKGDVTHGNVLVLLPGPETCTAEAMASYADAVQCSGKDICTVFGGVQYPETQLGRGSYLWIRDTQFLNCLQDGDMLEYNLAAGRIYLDLTPEGFRRRVEGKTSDPFVVTQLDENTWSILDRYSRMFLAAGRSRALLVDTGFGTADPRPLIRSLTDLPLDVVLTHAHWDHAGGISYFSDLWISEKELPILQAAVGGDCSCRLRCVADGQIFDLGGRALRAIACPGHTPGSVVLLDESRNMLFSGDSVAEGPIYLFMPECSIRSFAAGLCRLKNYTEKITRIYPSHRNMDLDVSCITELANCVNGIIDGSIQGEGTCIFKPYTHCKTYWLGRCAIYFP